VVFLFFGFLGALVVVFFTATFLVSLVFLAAAPFAGLATVLACGAFAT